MTPLDYSILLAQTAATIASGRYAHGKFSHAIMKDGQIRQSEDTQTIVARDCVAQARSLLIECGITEPQV